VISFPNCFGLSPEYGAIHDGSDAVITAPTRRSSQWSAWHPCALEVHGLRLYRAKKEAHNASHRKVRARVEHTFARMKTWKILRDCRLKGDGVHYAMLGIARLHNLTLTG
jgi:hypothetical protein